MKCKNKDGWSTVSLGRILNLKRGYDLPNGDRKEGKYSVVASNSISGTHNEYKVKGPGVVTGRSGTIGSVQYIKNDFWPLNTALYVNDFKNNDRRFIYYFLKVLKLEKYKSGSGVPTLNRNHVLSLIVDIPPLEIQKKIGNFLYSLEEKINLNNKINRELEEMAKTIYDYWFVQFDFPDENGKPYKSSGGEMVWSEELKRKIPKGWEVKKLKEIESNIVTGKTPSTATKEFFNGDIPFITIGDIRENMTIVKTEQHLSREGAETQKNKYLPKGAMCVSCIASPGLIGFTTAEISQTNQQINSIIFENEQNKEYLYFALNNFFKFSKQIKTGSVFSNMNKGDFESIKLIKPSEKIILKFNGIMKSTFNKVSIQSAENQELTSLRDWLLPMLMNGQVGIK